MTKNPLARLLLIVLLLPSPAFSSSIEMEYTLGFNGIYKLGTWTPLTITLENRIGTARGILEVVVSSGSEYGRNVRDVVYSTEVELPGDSKKIFSFTVFIDSFVHPLIVRLKQNGSTLVSSSLNLRKHYTERDLVLVLGARISTNLLSSFPGRTHAAYVRTQMLPETWFGYGGVATLILHAESLATLRPNQYTALTKWLRQGGSLVATAGLNYGFFSSKEIQSILPITISGIERLSKPQSLEEYCGKKLANPDPFLLLNARIDNSQTVLEENGLPIIIEKRYGRGRIVFLAFDYQKSPFNNWDGRYSFWEKLLKLKSISVQFDIDLDGHEIQSALLSENPGRFPRFLIVFAFLAIYAFLIKFAFDRVGDNTRPRWKNLTVLLAIILISSAASYRLYFYKNKENSLTFNSFLQLKKFAKGDIAFGEYTMGTYSTQNGEYGFAFGPDAHPIIPVNRGKIPDKSPVVLVLETSGNEQTALISVERWSYRFLKTNALFDFPLIVEASMDMGGLSIVIENTSKHTIVDGRFYFAGSLFSLGKIPPNERHTRSFSRDAIMQKQLFSIQTIELYANSISDSYAATFQGNMRKSNIYRILRSIHQKYSSKKDKLLFFGWIDSSIVPVNFTGSDIVGKHVSLLEWEIPLNRNDE